MTLEDKAIQSLTTKFSSDILKPFYDGIEKYKLISNGDRIAVCVSGGKDSAILAMLMKWYEKNKGGVTVKFISMDPGYTDEHRRMLEENCKRLGIDAEFFETDILACTEKTNKSPCGICARMRRGWLYRKAKEAGCNKIALGHHFDDVIETTLMGMLYGAQIQGMLPRLKSRNFEGMELIRPMYMVPEDAIIRWSEYNGLEFITCACKYAQGEDASKRAEVKALISQLEKTNPRVRKNIFNSIHNADCDTLVGYKVGWERHSFLERFEENVLDKDI